MVLNQKSEEEDEEDEDNDDDKEMIDFNDLDESQRKQLIIHLFEMYQKNPAEFPFSKNDLENILIQYDQIMKEEGEIEGGESQINQEEESIKDIKSEEMVIEEQQQNEIEGGEQEI